MCIDRACLQLTRRTQKPETLNQKISMQIKNSKFTANIILIKLSGFKVYPLRGLKFPSQGVLLLSYTRTTHLSKGSSGCKQRCTQFLTPFLGTEFHGFSHGVIHFVWSVDFKSLEMEVSDWLLKKINQ